MVPRLSRRNSYNLYQGYVTIRYPLSVVGGLVPIQWYLGEKVSYLIAKILYAPRLKRRAMDAFHKATELSYADTMYFVASQSLSFDQSEDEGNVSLIRLHTINMAQHS